VTDPFVHLHVASGYSLRHGASSPQALVDRAVEHGMGTLALTDRDGLYGSVKFVLACRQAGLTPLLGVDLATAPTGRGRPRSVWVVLPGVAPELAEWATFFDAGAARRAAVEAGRDDAVSTREADDLLRDAERFLLIVESALGLPRQDVLPRGGLLPLSG